MSATGQIIAGDTYMIDIQLVFSTNNRNSFDDCSQLFCPGNLLSSFFLSCDNAAKQRIHRRSPTRLEKTADLTSLVSKLVQQTSSEFDWNIHKKRPSLWNQLKLYRWNLFRHIHISHDKKWWWSWAHEIERVSEKRKADALVSGLTLIHAHLLDGRL